MRKSLLTYLSEAIDAYRSDKSHLSLDDNSSPVITTHSAVRRPSASVKWLIPNGGTILIVLVLLLTQQVWARNDLPEAVNSSLTTISYQGRLLDSNSQPVNDPGLGISFRLYDVDTGGTPLWSEDYIGVPVQDGLFHVLLGSIVPIPVSLLSTNSTLWLGIQIGSDTEMTPREQIAGVPFAMVAGTVLNEAITTEKIADQAVTQAKLGPDVNLLPPPGSITTAMLANDAVTAAKIAADSVNEGHLNLSTFSISLGANIGITSSSSPGQTLLSFPDLTPGTYMIYGLAAGYVDPPGDTQGAILFTINDGTTVLRSGPQFYFTEATGWQEAQAAGFTFVITLPQTTTLNLSAYKGPGALTNGIAGGGTYFGYIKVGS